MDIRERFGVGPDDRVLALAGLGFDLSVFDVLGVLGAGGAMVLPDPRRRDDPSHWAALFARPRVTLWNSVPAQARMLPDYRDAVAATGGSPGGPTAGDAPSTLRLALLSGDWIPVTLPDAMRAGHPELTVVSLGGATEAAIWSVHHVIGEVDRLLPSIPYGTPLRGQRLAVVDHLGRDRPEGVPGEILIRGAGVALGYLGDAERTRERFGVDPATGDREYRPGDIGRYLPDGSIELLGREDAQVKIRGYRIELAEIQAAVLAHPGVADCAVQVAEGTAGRHLVGLVQPERIAPGDAPEDHAPGDAARAALQLAAADVDTDALGAFLAQFDEHALRVIERTLAAAGVRSSTRRRPSPRTRSRTSCARATPTAWSCAAGCARSSGAGASRATPTGATAARSPRIRRGSRAPGPGWRRPSGRSAGAPSCSATCRRRAARSRTS